MSEYHAEGGVVRARYRPVIASVAVIGVVLAAAAHAPSAAAPSSEPDLEVGEATASAALRCPREFRGRRAEPVLLIHGTAVTARDVWAWNYSEVLEARGFDVCTIALPRRALGDVQVSSEYVVHAIRLIARVSARKIDLVTHSQGGLEARWAIRWWPSAGALVDDVVTLAGTHHGVSIANNACEAFGECQPAVWQQRRGSRFLRALNRGDETPGAASYTSIYSRTDEIVRPVESAVLDGATNVAVQDLCPGRVVIHHGLLADATAFTVALDALTRPGPADPSDLPGLPCRAMMRQADPAAVAAGLGRVHASAVIGYATSERVAKEPAVAAYAR